MRISRSPFSKYANPGQTKVLMDEPLSYISGTVAADGKVHVASVSGYDETTGKHRVTVELTVDEIKRLYEFVTSGKD